LLTIAGFRIGGSPTREPAGDWDGLVDDVAVFGSALNDEQVWALYQGTETPLSLANASPELSAPEPVQLVPGSWSMVVLPDLQKYSETAASVKVLDEMLEWVASQREERGIQTVLEVGDTTETNSVDEWSRVRASFGQLDGQVPYILAAGNHDYAGRGNSDPCYRCTFLNDYFSAADSPQFRGAYQDGYLENAYYEFVAPDARKMLVLSLEWAPRAEVVQWANAVTSGTAPGLVPGQFDDHTVVLLTHAYLYNDNRRYDWLEQGAVQENSPHQYTGTLASDFDGQQLWDGLVAPHAGFAFTFSGHVIGDKANVAQGEGYLRSEVAEPMPAHVVHQFLFNTQILANGGNGWLMLVEFLPDQQTALIKYYSPYLESWRQDYRIIDLAVPSP
jgi:hypothetical protein